MPVIRRVVIPLVLTLAALAVMPAVAQAARAVYVKQSDPSLVVHDCEGAGRRTRSQSRNA